MWVVIDAPAADVAVAVAAVLAAVVALLVDVFIAVDVVLGSDVEKSARRPTCRLYWFLQHILRLKCRSHRHGRCSSRCVRGALFPMSFQGNPKFFGATRWNNYR